MPIKDVELKQRLQDHEGHLLDQLYSCVLDHGAWDDFLRELVALSDSRSARLLLLDNSASTVLYSTKVNIDDQDHQRYVSHYVNTCPWRLELSEKPRGQLYSTFHDFSCRQEAFYRTEFFNDWARELDIHHGICGTAYESGPYKVQLLVQRTSGQGAYSRRTTQLLNGLLPHMRQVLRLSQQAQLKADPLWGARTAAEMCPLPFILFNRQGQVVYVSQRCEALLGQRELEIIDSRLRLPEPAVQQRFLAAFAVVCDAAGTTAAREAALNIRRHGRATLRCLLTPVHPSAEVTGLWPGNSQIALYIHDPESVLAIDACTLADIYNLTESEARIAIDIARGLDPQFIADRDNRSAHTVRAQLKSVFTKTRCHRQNELAALILQSPAARRC